MGTIAVTCRFANRAPGTGSRRSRTLPSSVVPARFRAQTGPRASPAAPARREPDLDEGADQHREGRRRPGRRDDAHRVPRPIAPEQPGQALVRPTPIVMRRWVVDLDAVGRGENAAAGGSHPAQLLDGQRRVVAVLEHLGAEDDVEAAVGHGQRLDGADQLRVRVRDDVHADVLARNAREEGVVGLDAAADVQDAEAGSGRAQFLRFRAQPARQGGAHDPRRRGRGRVAPLLAGPGPAGASGVDASDHFVVRVDLYATTSARRRSNAITSARMSSRDRSGVQPVAAVILAVEGMRWSMSSMPWPYTSL